MRVPFITSHRRSIAEPESQQVSRRASTRPVGSITFWGANRTVSAYSPGDSVTSRSIQDGSPFADRTAGGGDRSLIYGSRAYGSGLTPATPATARGVSGSSFLFYFWPVVWTVSPTGYGQYFYNQAEFGAPTNAARPGGALYTTRYTSKANTGSSFRILSDKLTIESLETDIQNGCGNFIGDKETLVAYTSSSVAPKPEQAVQYYRGSTVVLTFDGYNNSAVYVNQTALIPDSALPSNLDSGMLGCLNQTIGEAVPLVDKFIVTGGNNGYQTSFNAGILLLVVFVGHVLGRM